MAELQILRKRLAGEMSTSNSDRHRSVSSLSKKCVRKYAESMQDACGALARRGTRESEVRSA